MRVGPLRRGLFAVCLALLCCPALAAVAAAASQSWLEDLEQAVVETGLGMDQIPAIDRPEFLGVADAGLVVDRQDIVFVAELPDGMRIYPREILVWHEIVNETVGNEKFSVTYCPLTGSVIGYKGTVGRYKTSFGTSGRLVNSNLVMYDRATGSLWPQILGQAVDGPLMGKALEAFPVLWTTWDKASKRYPGAKVLSRATGFDRDYNRDPYGSYRRDGTYYQNDQILHYLTHKDRRLHPKTRIIGITAGSTALAVTRERIQQEGALEIDMAMTPLLALYDPGLGAVRVFERRARNMTLRFTIADGRLLDQTTRSEWTMEGEAVSGNLAGERMRPVIGLECMWFGWAAFYPATELMP
jgi:hypothetical protein